MCHDCNPLETNTGLVIYSGPNLTLCTGKTITNGESMTSVIEKIQYCIDIINQEIDITGLVENSSCITLLGTSIKDVLQSILNTESAFCTQLADLEAQITLIWNTINGGPTVKNVNITSCNPTFDISLVETPTQKTFKLGAFVPKKTILPYFGDIGDFFTTGLGKPSAGLSGWAIADGRNGTINACGRYLKYNCAGCCTTGGSNTVTLGTNNIPTLSFNVTAEFDLNFTGETELAGKHRHRMSFENDDSGACNSCNDGIPYGDEIPCQNTGIQTEDRDSDACNSTAAIGAAGEHSHTFTVDSTATGTFTGTIPNSSLTPINIEPSYIAGIPIQFVGC